MDHIARFSFRVKLFYCNHHLYYGDWGIVRRYTIFIYLCSALSVMYLSAFILISACISESCSVSYSGKKVSRKCLTELCEPKVHPPLLSIAVYCSSYLGIVFRITRFIPSQTDYLLFLRQKDFQLFVLATLTACSL